MNSRPYTLRDFLPLIGALTAVAVLTIVAVTQGFLPATPTGVMQAIMGFFFLIFGGFKAVRVRGFADAFSMYDIIAKQSRTYALMYPFIELILGIAYLSSYMLATTNIVTLAVMGVGAIGVWQKLREKEEIPCACMGAVFTIPMTWVTLGEDLGMAAMAAAMLIML